MNESPNSNICNICVDNFSNNETVYYSVVILKGRLKSRCENGGKHIFACFNKNEARSAIYENRFKLLLEISLKENAITLKMKCCAAQIEINLYFQMRETSFSVTPLYIICQNHSGRFQAPGGLDNSVEAACKRIVLGAKLLQCLFAEKLYENSLGRKTFRLNLSNTSGHGCAVFRSVLDKSMARNMKSPQLWKYFGREIMNSPIGDWNTKYLAFLSCTKYRGDKFSDILNTHGDLVGITEAYVALGGGGLALFGAACLYTWPISFEDVLKCFEDKTAIDKTKFLDDTCYRGTYGTCFSTTLGSVCHELSHTFDLGHTPDGIMGRGFDDVDLIFKFSNAESAPDKEPYWTKSCAVLLANHRWFNAKRNQMPKIVFNLENKVIKSTSGLRVVEVRRESDEMVLCDWTFVKKPLRFDFQLSVCDSMRDVEGKLLLVVENDSGFVLKEPFCLSK